MAARERTCFVIMPFGEKTAANPFWTEHDALGREIDFDAVYDELVVPAIEGLGIECRRCDRVARSGSLHRQMIEEIVGADVAVVDLTTLNPNVFYELGVRHALKPSVTVLLRHRGIESTLPFNIGGMNVVDYDVADPAGSIERIRAMVRRGVADLGGQDSLVFDVLGDDLTIDLRTPRMAPAGLRIEWTVGAAPDRRVGVVGGDIADVRGVEIWVTSENTDLQLARYHEPSLSATVRYLAAARSMSGRILDDLLDGAVRTAMAEEHISSLPPGEVLPVSAGDQLLGSHGVRWVFLAASVIGQRGKGYRPIPDVAACVHSAFAVTELAAFQDRDRAIDGSASRSILFPIFGTGRAGGDLHASAVSIVDAVVDGLARASIIERAYLLAWTQDELERCVALLDERADTTRAEPGTPVAQ